MTNTTHEHSYYTQCEEHGVFQRQAILHHILNNYREWSFRIQFPEYVEQAVADIFEASYKVDTYREPEEAEAFASYYSTDREFEYGFPYVNGSMDIESWFGMCEHARRNVRNNTPAIHAEFGDVLGLKDWLDTYILSVKRIPACVFLIDRSKLSNDLLEVLDSVKTGGELNFEFPKYLLCMNTRFRFERDEELAKLYTQLTTVHIEFNSSLRTGPDEVRDLVDALLDACYIYTGVLTHKINFKCIEKYASAVILLYNNGTVCECLKWAFGEGYKTPESHLKVRQSLPFGDLNSLKIAMKNCLDLC